MKNGFTLVEMLGVLAILTIIFILVFPSVKEVIDQGKDTTYQKQINTILSASYDWALKNPNLLPEEKQKTFITLSNLKKANLIDSNIMDPDSKKAFPDNLVISIKNVGGNYKNKTEYSKQGGDYLFTAEIKFMNSLDFINNKPSINLQGLTPDSNGNYTTKINLNDKFNNVKYTSTSKENIDLTSRVIVNIYYDGIVVSEIDTNKIGIYYINYTVVDDDGYSNTIKRNVIIVDESAPEIILPTETTISKNVTSYDLMKDVSCKDNSEICDVTTNDKLNFGVPGKYVIEYIAKDPSGNLSSSKRVITIE